FPGRSIRGRRAHLRGQSIHYRNAAGDPGRAHDADTSGVRGGAKRLAPSRATFGLARKLEDVALKRDASVEFHDLRESEPVVDAELTIDEAKNWVVPVEEAVAVAQGAELLCPDRELKL